MRGRKLRTYRPAAGSRVTFAACPYRSTDRQCLRLFRRNFTGDSHEVFDRVIDNVMTTEV